MYDIIAMIDHSRDTLVLTTHSPLHTLRTQQLHAGLLHLGQDRTRGGAGRPLDLDFSKESWLNPAIVSVWELRDGYIENYDGERNVTIQDSDGLVRGNYFDRVMSNIMSDFNTLVTLDPMHRLKRRFHKARSLRHDCFVADYTEYTASQVGVVMSETPFDDIEAFHLQSGRHPVSYLAVNLEEHPSFIKHIENCECFFLSTTPATALGCCFWNSNTARLAI